MTPTPKELSGNLWSSMADAIYIIRYPFYSCELLCCDSAKVFDTFFPKDDESNEGKN